MTASTKFVIGFLGALILVGVAIAMSGDVWKEAPSSERAPASGTPALPVSP